VTITCAAALNNLSTAAELGSVELIFMNAVASVGHGRRLSMDFTLAHGSMMRISIGYVSNGYKR